MPTRQNKPLIFLVLVFFLMPFLITGCAGTNPILETKKNVILDTDIGSDIDDVWALTLLLRSPEFNIKLITTATGDTTIRARIVAKILQADGKEDIPIGIGAPVGDTQCFQENWVKSFDLSKYKGKIYKDGVDALINTIMQSPEPITVIAIGPLSNISEALKRQPMIAQKANFIGMHGSVRVGYDGRPEIDKEYNVVKDIKAAQNVFTAPWDITVTPLDTCGTVQLKGQKYQQILNSKDSLTQLLIDSYRDWLKYADFLPEWQDANISSTILYDTVAVYLGFSQEFVHMEELSIRVDDEGYMRIDDDAKKINCAMKWKELGAFEDWLIERLAQ